MKAYKGFNKDMTCTPCGKAFQFEEGKTYEEPEAKICERGFHACENPLDCWSHYDILNGVFHEVELDDVSDQREKNSTKICAKKITIGARLDIKGIVKASVDFVMSSVRECFDKKILDKKVVSKEDGAQIGSSGYGAKIGSSGYGAQIELAGERSVGACVGAQGKIKAKAGCWIILTEWKRVDEEITPVCVKAVQVDGEAIKEDTWYKLEDGEIVEAEE